MTDYQLRTDDVDEITRLFSIHGSLDEASMADVNHQITGWLDTFKDKAKSAGKGDIIVDVRGLESYPSAGQSIKMGTEVTGHEHLWYVAIVGAPGPVRAMFDLLHIFGGKRFQFFETVEEAQTFLQKNKHRRPK